jgi:hypothetical protein
VVIGAKNRALKIALHANNYAKQSVLTVNALKIVEKFAIYALNLAK